MVMRTRSYLMLIIEPTKQLTCEPIYNMFLYCLANLLIGITFSVDKIFQAGERN